ncbi:MAG: hypothetical protein MI806_07365 [Minwuiales bacterium]|nr:hypothetical protein [Minwuiales bacterium]
MERRIAFLIDNYAEAATFTPDVTTPGLDAANLVSGQPSEPHRQPGDEFDIEIDLGAAREVDVVWARNVNWSEAGTWRWRAATTQAGLLSAPDFEVGFQSYWPAPAGQAIPGYVNPILFLDQPQTYRHWRLDMSDPTNPEPHRDAGGIGLAKAVHPQRNFQFPLQFGKEKRTETAAADSGAEFDLVRTPRLYVQPELWLSQAEALGVIGDMEQRLAAGRAVGCVPYPDRPETYFALAIFGKVRDLGGAEQESLAKVTHRLRFVEQL